MRKIMNMDTRTWRESFTMFGIVAAYFMMAVLSVKLFQWTTTLSNTSQAVFKWTITALALFGVVVVAKMTLQWMHREEFAGGKAFLKRGAGWLAATVFMVFVVAVLWKPNAVDKLTFYSLLVNVAMLSTIILAAAHLVQARKQTEASRKQITETRKLSRAFKGTTKAINKLRPVLHELDSSALVSLTSSVKSLHRDVAKRAGLRFWIVQLLVIGVAVTLVLIVKEMIE